ncbi:MAG: CotH kinase family protein, partial [Verrucomicrobiales bacterium]|nr:CotH kinase family protein [Verrucomicrobiales bacterium]
MPLRKLRWPLVWLLGWLLLGSGATGFGAPRITEFQTSNEAGLADADGDFPDWIEIHNPDGVPVSLAGYSLTDAPTNPQKWVFPAVTLPAGGYLVVFASGKDRSDPAGPLHTDFQLSSTGEYLALLGPDGVTAVSAFAPGYPPQLPGESFGIDPTAAAPGWAYFRVPTPGAPNGNGRRAGPVIQPMALNPPAPTTGPLTIAVKVLPTNDAVGTVRLFYRRMFAAETGAGMVDDGTGGDAVADDGIWSATIPAAALAPGEMTRWRVVASDRVGVNTTAPAYHDPLDADQYYGTVAQDPALQTALPVLHWFTTNVARAGTTAGARGAVYYDGEFYDNVLFTVHGQSSAGFPKKSYNLDFNRGHHFQWSTNAPRVADIDLLSNWADKSKVRHVLAYEVMRRSGVAAHFAYTVRVQHNGAFFSTADLVEDADETYLERAGLNPDGALYKVYANTLNKDAGNTGNSGVEKKTRRSENNNDLQELINGLDLTGPALERYLYDHVDIPA